MGASGWNYVVGYQADLQAAFEALQAKVLAEGDYWWAARDSSARDCADRPRSIEELFADEHVQESGTHSILDMDRVLKPGEPPRYGWMAEADGITSPADLGRLIAELGQPEYGTVAPVTAAEALECVGAEKLTRDHLSALEDLGAPRGFGRVAILHDAGGVPDALYFWGVSGD
jgi:hypothetical protein